MPAPQGCQSAQTLYYITLHYITLHYFTLPWYIATLFEASAYFSRLPYSCPTQPVASDTITDWGNAGKCSSVRGQLGSPPQAA